MCAGQKKVERGGVLLRKGRRVGPMILWLWLGRGGARFQVLRARELGPGERTLIKITLTEVHTSRLRERSATVSGTEALQRDRNCCLK